MMLQCSLIDFLLFIFGLLGCTKMVESDSLLWLEEVDFAMYLRMNDKKEQREVLSVFEIQRKDAADISLFFLGKTSCCCGAVVLSSIWDTVQMLQTSSLCSVVFKKGKGFPKIAELARN